MTCRLSAIVQTGTDMKLSRRKFLARLAIGASANWFLPRVASALDYPTRPVRLIVSFPAGGPNDVVARLVAQWLSEQLGQPIIIENRSGAGGTIGTEVVVHAPPDGYTLLQVNTPNAINATLYDNLNYNFIRDIVPVASIVRTPLVMEVNPSFPAKTVPDFIAFAKANPGKVNMASGGNGTPGHVAGELFKMMAGISMVHVPYRGGALALTDLLGGHVQGLIDPIPASIGYLRAGKLWAVAVTTTTRSDVLPDTPTVDEFIPGYEASAWYGMGAPRGTPAEIVNRLNAAINACLADPTLRARLAEVGGIPFLSSPAEFVSFIAAETEKWAKVIKFAGIKQD
jgi:tripartite-type tricarboxylate transporter receptor subunit TctC